MRKRVLITGGTGSFGRRYIKQLLNSQEIGEIVVFSRDEMKQWDMELEFQNNPKLRFFVGDIRDRDRVYRAFRGVDVVVHAAALKIVPKAEYNPFEYIKTNINGAMNVVDAAIDCGVHKVVALSTDKACSPVNLYGATKLVSDKVFVASNSYANASQTKFAVVRYGNVINSRGSVIPFFKSLAEEKTLPITHPDMTRFLITLDQGIDLVNFTLKKMQGGEIFVKKIPSVNIVKMAEYLFPNREQVIVGIRPGEKLHEEMISIEDAPHTFEYADHFVIEPVSKQHDKSIEKHGIERLVSSDFVYSSDRNPDFISKQDFLQLVGCMNEN